MNTGEYEGGELCFPEFGSIRSSPPTGTAIIFSSEIKHQVRPITRDKRFVMSMFLYDEQGHKMREKLEGQGTP